MSYLFLSCTENLYAYPGESRTVQLGMSYTF